MRSVLSALTVGALAAATLTSAALTSAALTSPAAAATTGAALAAARGGKDAPVPISVTTNLGGLAPGYTFVAPKAFSNPTTTPSGPEIVDAYGRPVWWHEVAAGVSATDFRVQTYRGQPVLTWNEGVSTGGPGHSSGTDYIADSHYRIIATVNAGNGLSADQHEFQLTPQGTALITSYHVIPFDLSSVGGPVDGQLFDSTVQEVDVATGRVLLQWDASKHVPLTDSYAALPADPTTTPWDYFHVNDVKLDSAGNLIVNGRHTWTVYDVDRHSGNLLWRLGGKRSTFTLGPGVSFAWQHDAEQPEPGIIRLFDNDSNGTPVRPQSRVLTIALDTAHRRATLVSTLTHPEQLSSGSQGNAQGLPDGHTVVGWGQLGRFSEFDAAGRLIWDAHVPAGDDDYRAYRSPWVGTPTTKPTATVATRNGRTTVHAIWNGATKVVTWQFSGGSDPDHLTPLTAVPWNGLDTSTTVPGAPAFVQAVALDARGTVLGTSTIGTA